MAWIKKNLVFVICSGVALLLLGVAIWFMFSAKGKDAAVQEELNQELSNWQSLNTGGAFPSEENIAAAKAEQERFKQFRKESAALVPIKPAPSKLSDQAFAGLLGNTIAELRSTAAAAGVVIPPQYDFTFSAQRKSLNFPAGSIETYILQLNDIKSICNVLFQARVGAIDGLQRAPISEQDAAGSEFLTSGTIISNQFAFVTPYLVTFRGFTPELAAVIEQVQRSTNFILIKSISVMPSQTGIGPLEGGNVGGGDPNLAYLQSRSTPAPVRRPDPRAKPGAPVNETAETILSEHPLQVTLLLDVVKLNPVQ